MNNPLITPIEYLKGVGPQRAELLKKEIGVFTFEDLLYHFPFRYIDRSEYHSIASLGSVIGPVQLRGRLIDLTESGVGRNKRLSARFEDQTGLIELIWFQGVKWVKNSIKLNQEVIVYGRPKLYGVKWTIPHPEISAIENEKGGLQPVYPSTEKLSSAGLHSKGIEKLIGELLPQVMHVPEEYLPEEIRSEYGLIDIGTALKWIHMPENDEQAGAAQFRFKFEELFFLQMELLVRKQITMQKSKGFVFDQVGEAFNSFYNSHLPFELTGAQKRVLREIRKDMGRGTHMNRLLQGDVGSGKTLVALLTILLGIDNGYQGALMAPTEILANQHFESLQELLSEMDLTVELLTGSTRKKERTRIHEGLMSGQVDILVGTHALLEEVVQFKDLGVVVIDEQHRFGVAQRAKMWKKNSMPPHVLIMTATPIPRTLAMTFYGDLDVSVIDELPPGRKPITTIHRFESSRLRLFGFLKEEIAKGRQIYIVYPLIKESDTLDFNNLMSGYEAISRAFPLPEYKVSIVHGKMKPEDKDFEMERFVKGETNIMVATTVIEVGVNVPNASVMVIESAERFGLSQLHQLRGRVGRGSEKSFCILMTGDKLSNDSLKRMQTMVNTSDGFEIAEVDLQLRGPGDLMGTQQSGIMNLRIADLVKDNHLVGVTREAAKSVLLKDAELESPGNKGIRQRLSSLLRSRPNWGKIA